MNKLILVACLFPFFQVFADGSVRFADLEDDLGAGIESVVQANDGGASFFYSIYDEPSGDGTSTSAPGLAWLPVKNGKNQEENVTISNKTLVPTITSPSNALVRVSLRVTNSTGSDRYLYAAVQDPDNSSNYKVISSASGPFGSSSSTVLSNLTFQVENFCISADCTNLQTGTTSTKNFLVYFFLDSQSNRGLDTDINPSSQTGGVFLRLYLSARIPSSTIDLQDVRPGDGRARALFTGSTINDLYRTLGVANGTGAALTGGSTIQAALAVSGTQLLDLESTSTSGEVTIRPLVNGVSYDVALIFEDKYQFATTLSNVETANPEQIEALLESQACYILSAGFQEKHFITDYFRALRDRFLLKTTVGTWFVNWYYETAPIYAPHVYRSPWLASIVRIFAYGLWFLINMGLVFTGVWAVAKVVNKLKSRLFKGLSETV